jgi:hypothetical protein
MSDDRIGVRSYLVEVGDPQLETLVLHAFIERIERSPEGTLRDWYALPLLPQTSFPDEGSRNAYYAHMEQRLRELVSPPPSH